MGIFVDFLAEQVLGLIVSGLTNSLKNRQYKKMIVEKEQELERKYTQTAVDSDAFFQYYRNYHVSQSMWDYWHLPDQMTLSEKAFVGKLAGQYGTYRQERGQAALNAEDRTCVGEFLMQVMQVYHLDAVRGVSDGEKAAAGIVNQQVIDAKEEILREVRRLSADKKNKSADIFKRKFHRRLFLEEKDGPSLAQVYIWPDCRIGSGDTVSAADYIENFLKCAEAGLLVVEGMAGSGKSSLMMALSEVYDGEAYHYLSLKDLVNRAEPDKRTDFLKAVRERCGLKADDMDRILFLDGYDELHSHLDTLMFRDDLNELIELGYRIVMTTRPNYLETYLLPEGWQKIRLELFSDEQIRLWLAGYGVLRPQLKSGTVEALLNVASVGDLNTIRRIPIMLYVIANRNISVDTVSCMGDLYDRVFEGLKRDKSGLTKEVLEQHYRIAQKVAFHMHARDILQADASQVRQWCGDMFDESFFSSVYIENSIIEGTEILEFVHKSILEFFAAKWIFNGLQTEGELQTVLKENCISDEILAYLQYFYGKKQAQDEEGAKKIRCCIREGFMDFIRNGVQTEERSYLVREWECIKGCLFHNFILLIKYLLEEPWLTEELVGDEGHTCVVLLRNYLDRGMDKPAIGYRLLQGETLSVLPVLSFMDMAGRDLSSCLFQQVLIGFVDFHESNCHQAVFADVRFENCSFKDASLYDTLFQNVVFDDATLKNIRFDYAKLDHVSFPDGKLYGLRFVRVRVENMEFEKKGLDRLDFTEASLERVHFSQCTLNQCVFRETVFDGTSFSGCRLYRCDFSGVPADTRCNFGGCRIDRATRKTNPELFQIV